MQHSLVKYCVLRLVSWGFKIPEPSVDRFNELSHLKRLLELLKINCVLDVGANRGQFSHELRAIGYSGFIISFEPIQHVFEVLSHSFSEDPKWIGHQIALGSNTERTKINIPDLTVLSSILESVDTPPSIKTQDIDVKRLDEIFPSIIEKINNPRIFLKMDTQGYDVEVFRGAQQCLDYVLGLQSELSVQPLYKNMPHYNDALLVYEKAGFELYNLSVVARTPSGGAWELNAFMRRPTN